jgi:hypothetical protein
MVSETATSYAAPRAPPHVIDIRTIGPMACIEPRHRRPQHLDIIAPSPPLNVSREEIAPVAHPRGRMRARSVRRNEVRCLPRAGSERHISCVITVEL